MQTDTQPSCKLSSAQKHNLQHNCKHRRLCSRRSQINGPAVETDNLTAQTQADTRTGIPLGRIERHKYLFLTGFAYRFPVIGHVDYSTLPLVYGGCNIYLRSPGLNRILYEIIHYLRNLSKIRIQNNILRKLMIRNTGRRPIRLRNSHRIIDQILQIERFADTKLIRPSDDEAMVPSAERTSSAS